MCKHWKLLEYIMKESDCRDGLAVKATDWTYRGPGFHSLHLQPSAKSYIQAKQHYS